MVDAGRRLAKGEVNWAMSGHHPVRIGLNRSFEEELGPDGVRAYVEALVATGQELAGRTTNQVADRLHERLDRAGIRVPALSYERSAEQLIESAGQLLVVSADGMVLHGVDRPTQPVQPDTEPTH